MAFQANAPKLALGEMAMRLNDKIAIYMPDMQSPRGIGRVYELVRQLDDLLTAYRSLMYFKRWNPETKSVDRVEYYEKKHEIMEKIDKLSFSSPEDFPEWSECIHDYLSLLSSCYSKIGLAPAQIKINKKEMRENSIKVKPHPSWGK